MSEDSETPPAEVPCAELERVLAWCGEIEARRGIRDAIEMYLDEL